MTQGVSTVANEVLEEVLAQPEIVAGAIYVLDERRSTLEQIAGKGLPEDSTRASISVGEGRLGRVVSTGRPVDRSSRMCSLATKA